MPDDQPLQRARRLYAGRRYREAQALFLELLATEPRSREALEYLVMLAMQEGDAGRALDYLSRLIELCPDEPLYCSRFASLAQRCGRGTEALEHYRRLLQRRPELLAVRYQLARLQRGLGLDREALRELRQCLEGGIDCAEQVHTDMGAIYADLHLDDEAEQALSRALEQQPRYAPALYNLALLWEERGDWDRAAGLYEQVLDSEPTHAEALARLVQGRTLADPSDPLLGRLRTALDNPGIDDAGRESLHYGLGKGLDDTARYPEAFAHYTRANALSRRRVGDYDPGAQEALVDRLIEQHPPSLAETFAPVSAEPLIFICGMFRSGSTLLEQMLAAHPNLRPGGEIDYFARRVALSDLLERRDPTRWREWGVGYLAHLEETFGAGARVTDKRPDNFPYLGLIRCLFPRARVLATWRQPLDNCLSVYFQQLGAGFPYANDLRDIAHYLAQYRRLMTHWELCLGDNLLTVNYEQLVERPQAVLEPALRFLGLEWDPACLQFYRVANRVRTASVAQVRQPLYAHARDRWRHYEGELAELGEYLESTGVPLGSSRAT